MSDVFKTQNYEIESQMETSKSLAPIVLFVYNRPWHTQQTIEALQQNGLASNSELFIYSDGAKNEQASEGVEAVREYIETINGFKKVTIIKRDKNWGLADSIIDGVTKIVNEYGKIIVLEDDLVTSPFFLKFMNDALDFYQYESKVWHISGWNYPIEIEGIGETFVWQGMNCWGWATWADRWVYFEKDIDKVISEFNPKEIKAFNLDGEENFFDQILANKKGKINTWGVFWYASIYKKKGLCLNPSQTYVENIGLDGEGINCGKTEIFSNRSSKEVTQKFTTLIQEHLIPLDRIKNFYKINSASRSKKIKNIIHKIYINEQFNPSVFGIFINPFYFSRKELNKAITELIINLKGTLLDIGCGSKPYEKFCICDKYIGLEVDNKESRLNKKADYYYNGDVLPFEKHSIDSILTSQVFEHVNNPGGFLQEIYRVLKDEGLLLLSVPLVWDEHEQPNDYVRFTSFGIKKILFENGFEVITLKKTANNFSAIVQLLTAYLFKTIYVKNKYINLLITVTLIAPINIIGACLAKILPENNDFYLDNVVLARKIKSDNRSIGKTP